MDKKLYLQYANKEDEEQDEDDSESRKNQIDSS